MNTMFLLCNQKLTTNLVNRRTIPFLKPEGLSTQFYGKSINAIIIS